ncbi:uncharacterized protein LOC132277552 [Cornus florida]|uniref:uncharacterized protein LOC132277552 n=1 Tax=Cornus florida TaxID=4283 RepID=UPI00289F7A60|nr:uncharacterized protein LOC132277552 [Cornus florida]
MFDGSSTSEGSGAGIMLISPIGNQISFSFFLDFKCSNNQVEYEALIIGLEILLEMAVKDVHIVGDSCLVINQISKDFRCLNWQLRPFHSLATQLVNQFYNVTLEYRPRAMNKITNDLAQTASGVRVPSGMKERIMKITCRSLPSAEARNQIMEEVFATDVAELDDDDWRIPYILFLQHPTLEVDRRIKRSAVDYVLIDGDLYRRSADDGLLFQCISKFESLKIMAEVHEGICGAHQAGIKMRWLIRRYGYYWLGMRKDCMTYTKGYIDCQKNGPMQWVPAIEMQLLVKPWPFRGWAMDLIGKINPPSSKGHHWIILATDYFTKWVEVEEYVSVTHNTVIQFLERHIFHRFGLPETIVADNESVFRANEVLQLGIDMQVKMVTSTPYYTQGNGQTEASNKVVIEIIEKMIKDKPRHWHKTLSEALWAYRNSKRTSTGTTPYRLTFGRNVVLPMELNVKSARVALQHNLILIDYNEAMLAKSEDLDEVQKLALDDLMVHKAKVMRAYNKRVKFKSFAESDMVWQTILPPGKVDRVYGKWLPTWKGLYLVHQVLHGGLQVKRSRW